MRSKQFGLMAVLLHCLALTSCAPRASAEDWPRFRGPNGNGVSNEDEAVPTTWSPTENLKWKVELPGAGVSSPIVVGDRVFVTCYSGYGVERNAGSLKDLKRHLVCLSASSGEILWTKTVEATQPEDPYEGIGVTAHGYASHTPVSDGKNVYVFFGKTGALAFDLDGNELWRRNLGTKSDPWAWGSSSSPLLYKNLLIVTASAESEALVALDTATGEQVWREAASGFAGMWGTPILVQTAGRTELVMSVPYEMWSFDPETGKLLWYCEASEAQQAHASAVSSDGVIYAVTGRGGGSIAVKAGGKDDVTKSNIVWKGPDSGQFGSPIVHEGKLYLVAGGILSCVDTKTGEKISQQRLANAAATSASEEANNADEQSGREQGGRGRGGRGGGFGGGGDYPSPIIANGNLYYLNGSGQTFVYKLGEKIEPVSVNKVTHDAEKFGGTPAISEGRIYLRSEKYLYCVGE